MVLKSQRWSSAGADSINPDNWKDFTPRIDYNEASCNLVSLAQRVDFMLAWARTGLLPVCSGGYEDTWVDLIHFAGLRGHVWREGGMSTGAFS